MKGKMTGAILPGNSTVEYREFDIPTPGHGQVLIKTMASTICGSDIRCIYREHTGKGAEGYIPGTIAGHEPCGYIVEEGEGLKRFKKGDRVIIYHISGCGVCYDCRRGYAISCTSPHRQAYGWQRNGGMAPYILAEEKDLIPLPDELTFCDGAQVACGFGTTYEALEKIGVSGDDAVLVVGLGPVGLATAMLAKAMGAQSVIGVEYSDERIEIAKSLGLFNHVFKSDDTALDNILSVTGGKGVEKAVDCSANDKGRQLAIRATRSYGKIAFVGEGNTCTFNPSPDIIHGQKTIYGSWVTSLWRMEELVEKLVRWGIHPDKLITHKFPLEKAAICFAVLNLFSIVFFVVVAFLDKVNATAASVCACVALAVLCADMIYAAASRCFALTRIIISIVAVILNFATGIVSGLSVFSDSANIAGVIILVAAYFVNAVIAVYSAFTEKEDKNEQRRSEKIVSLTLMCVGVCGLISMLVTGIVFATVPTFANTNAVNLTAVMISACAAFTALTVYGAGYTGRKKIVVVAAMAACVASVTPFAVIEGTTYEDYKRAELSFAQAFGDVEAEKGLSAPYNFALEFVGISTKNYYVEKDKEYFKGSGVEEGITLRYDAYYPTGESRGVLINLHGSGGDKDKGNYAHRNKYFASIGYTVFDIQYGDYNEAGTGEIPYYDTTLEWAESHLKHIDEFIKYASENEKSADWSNTFLTGVSMGGTQISRYALSYANSLSETSVVLRGIIPVYPGYSSEDEGVLNCLSEISEESVPCLVVMGEYDTVVSPEAADEYKSAYENAGNPSCAQIKISYAGHGCDYFMSGRSNQLLTYYMQRFMLALSK